VYPSLVLQLMPGGIGMTLDKLTRRAAVLHQQLAEPALAVVTDGMNTLKPCTRTAAAAAAAAAAAGRTVRHAPVNTPWY